MDRNIATAKILNNRNCEGAEQLRIIINNGICVAASCFARVGGNWNNTLLEGAFCVNLNNTVSNSNSNNGAVQSYP